jgi:hypothetical protein
MPLIHTITQKHRAMGLIVIALTFGAFQAPIPAGSAPALTAFQVNGNVGALPGGTGEVRVAVLSPLGTLADPVPTTIAETWLAVAPLSSGSFTVSVPWSSTLAAAVDSQGRVNIDTWVQSGSSQTSQLSQVAITPPASGMSSSSSQTTATPQVTLGTFSPFATGPAAALSAIRSAKPFVTGCIRTLLSSTEKQTLAGEAHSANVTNSTVTYAMSIDQYSSISAGVSINGGAFSFNGSVGIDNYIGSGGSITFGSGKDLWVGDSVYYGKYAGSGSCVGETFVDPTSSAGDTYQYAKTPAPGTNPWGTCHADPNGDAVVGAGLSGEYHRSAGNGTNYSGAVSVFGFSASASFGFNTNVVTTWAGTTTTYVCGHGTAQTSAVYNSPY